MCCDLLFGEDVWLCADIGILNELQIFFKLIKKEVENELEQNTMNQWMFGQLLVLILPHQDKKRSKVQVVIR